MPYNPPGCLPLNGLVSDLLSLYYEMERSKSKLSRFVHRVIRPLTGCETKGLVHASPVKSRVKNWASKSLRIFSGASLLSNGVKEGADDASSFMSPMPDELYSPPSEDQSPLSPFSLKDTSDLSSDEFDSVRLSFIHCTDIIDLFPATPITPRSQTSLPQHSQLNRPSMFTVLPRDFSNEIDQVHGTCRPRDDAPWHASEGTIRRSSTPFPLLSSSMPSQYYPPSNMPTRTRYLRSDSSPSYCELNLDGSPFDSFYSLSTDLTSTPNSQQSLGSLPLSPSFTIPSCPNTFLSTNLISTQLATYVSLPDLSGSRPSLSSSPSSPSSFRSTTSRVPGLERRAPGSLRSRFNPIYGSANPDEGHVPYGTIQF